MESDVLVVPASRVKTAILVMIGAAFVALGVWFLSRDASDIASRDHFNSPAFILGLGIVMVVFFGACVVVAFWRLISSKPSLELGSEGVRIFGISSTIFVPWREVDGLSVYEIHRTKMLVLHLTDPEKYIESGSRLRRSLARANFELCGSPIAIASSTVKMGFGEMQSLFETYLRRYRGVA